MPDSRLGQRSSYSEIAGAGVLEATKRRCDRILFYLRSAESSVSAEQLASHMRANRLPDYNLTMCRRDIARLERAGLVRHSGWTHPKQYEAVRRA